MQSPSCDACGGSYNDYVWCDFYEWYSCWTLQEWDYLASHFDTTQTAGETYEGGRSAWHDYNSAHGKTACKDFDTHYDELVIEFAWKPCDDWADTASLQGSHFLRMRSGDGLEFDVDVWRTGSSEYLRLIVKTPQDGGGLREWPTNANDRPLFELSNYRGTWTLFKYEIKLNTEGQSDGYFYLKKWNPSADPPAWETMKTLTSADVIGDPSSSVTLGFDEFCFSNFGENYSGSECEDYYSDVLKIYEP
jgi:hypothetical protein